MATVLIHFYLQHLRLYCLFLGNENIVKLGTGYWVLFENRKNLLFSGRKPMCPRRKNQFPLNRKYKIPNLQQKFRATRYTHLQQLVCVDHQLSLSSIYSLSSNTLMRPVGRGGVRDGNAVLAGITVTSSFQTLSAVCSGKIVVFIQYTISIQYRFYGNPVYTFQCLVLIKTHRGQVRQVRFVKFCTFKDIHYFQFDFPCIYYLAVRL